MQVHHEAIALSESGLFSLAVMAVSLLCSLVEYLLGFRDKRKGDTVRFANAAIAPGSEETGPRKPLVVQM